MKLKIEDIIEKLVCTVKDENIEFGCAYDRKNIYYDENKNRIEYCIKYRTNNNKSNLVVCKFINFIDLVEIEFEDVPIKSKEILLSELFRIANIQMFIHTNIFTLVLNKNYKDTDTYLYLKLKNLIK